MAGDVGQVLQVPGVGELIEICDPALRVLSHPIPEKIGANESGPTGDKNVHGCLLFVCDVQESKLKVIS
jgi:hypothetical protein